MLLDELALRLRLIASEGIAWLYRLTEEELIVDTLANQPLIGVRHEGVHQI